MILSFLTSEKSIRITTSFAVVALSGLLARGKPADRPAAQQSDRTLATVTEMIDGRTDVWGDAAMRQPNGASYEFFKELLPPVRWVNADFKHYPIVLSASRAAEKVRVISNGSAINASGGKQRMWFDQGMPVTFFVGDPPEPFGEALSRLETPAYLDGYLPIVGIRYKSGPVDYREEVFAPVDKRLSALGAAMVRFSMGDGGSKNGRVEARIGPGVRIQKNHVLNEKGANLVAFDKEWTWDAKGGALVADLRSNKTAELLVFTKPTDEVISMTKTNYDEAKSQCSQAWQDLLGKGVRLETPEPIINDAWRSLVIGNLIVAVGDLPHYSAGNAYGPSPSSPRHLYEAECGDTLRSLMLFGQMEVGQPMLKPMLEFPRKDTRFHVAGQKLQLLADFNWLTHDTATIRKYEPLWRQAENLILSSREADSGLLPKDNYAGDIHTQVYSLNSNANCWRGLRDLAAVLADMGSKDEARKLREQAGDYRKAILKAVDRSEQRDCQPPYIPIGLLSDEKAPDPLTSTQLGSYYDLICPYIIGSEIFGHGSERENCLLGYLQNHGGIAMGMMRTKPVQGQFKGGSGCVPLYALRYNLALQRRDEREKALVGFYGQLAQGMTARHVHWWRGESLPSGGRCKWPRILSAAQ